MLLVKRLMRARMDIAVARNLVSRARKELDVANSVEAAALSTTLPRLAMGRSTVTEEPVIGLA